MAFDPIGANFARNLAQPEHRGARTLESGTYPAVDIVEAPRKPGLARTSPRRLGIRIDTTSLFRERARAWRMTERDFALTAELSKGVVDDMLDAEKPLSVEAVLMLPDREAEDYLDTLIEYVRARRRAAAAHR